MLSFQWPAYPHQRRIKTWPKLNISLSLQPYKFTVTCKIDWGRAVIECLTQDWGAACLSLTGVTGLCPWVRHINPSLVLVQPRKACPGITEKIIDWDVINQITQKQNLQDWWRSIQKWRHLSAHNISPIISLWRVFHTLKSSYLCRPWSDLAKLQDFSLECVTEKIAFLFLNKNICCGYSKEPSQWDGSFEHLKHMLNLLGKKILQFCAETFCLSIPVKL